MEFKSKPGKLGRISRVHGINGGMVVETNVSFDEIENWPDWIFVYIDSGLVPFRLRTDECFVKDDHHLVIFVDKIDRPENCTELLGQSLFVPDEMMAGADDSGLGFSQLTGYRIMIEGYEGEGEFIEFVDISGNPLLNIDWNGSELLLPARDEFVLDIDEDKKILKFRIPDGLFDLN